MNPNVYRIEVSEIEHLLINKLKIVKNCCVIYDATVKEIVLFYEPIFTMNERMIRDKLALELPKYMLPTRYQVQASLPMNANGKIDRQKLKLQVESV